MSAVAPSHPLETDIAAAEPVSERASTARPFAHVRVARSIDEAATVWADLEARVSASPYQQRRWLAAWSDTEGRAAGLSVMIVIAEDAAGRPVALVPLGVRRRGLLRTAVFLGGRETNYNMGLFDPTVMWTASDAAHLLRLAARGLREGLDMVVLAHQPLTWRGHDNPLATLPRSQPSPSISHRTWLQRDADAFLREHQSGPGRKKLRAKAAHLGALGAVAHRVARTPDEIEAVVSAHLAQKAGKLATLGIAPPDSVALRRLFVRAATPSAGEPPPLELHALFCGDAIVATFGGLAHQGRFSGLLISYDVEPRYARSSPGELLLTAVLKAKCAEGFDSFDLGIGEARYKETYCPIPDPLVDVFLPLTPLGHLCAAAESLRLKAKSFVKRSPRAWQTARTLRRTIGRLRGGG